MHSERTRVIVEVALSITLATVLSYWKVTLPWNFAGGSISFAMVPLFVVALRRGVVAGVAAGALFGVIDYFIERFRPPRPVVLDYPIAFAAWLAARLIVRAHFAGRRAGGRSPTVPWVFLGGRKVCVCLSESSFGECPEARCGSIRSYTAQLFRRRWSSAALTGVLVPALDRAVPVSSG
jgi:hypothetical protein